jgi:hypothetical protein
MQVQLIDYTGAGAKDPARYAAERLVFTKKRLHSPICPYPNRQLCPADHARLADVWVGVRHWPYDL